MLRDPRLRLADIVEHATRALRYVDGLTLADLVANQLALDAVVHNVQIVGEAVKHVPAEVRAPAPQLAWKEAAALRDRLAHKYYDVSPTILWTVLRDELPALRDGVAALLARMDRERRDA